MNEYTEQAEKFLEKTNTKLTIEFIKYDLYFPGDKEKRLIWKFTLTRGSRSYSSTFGGSVNDVYKTFLDKDKPYRLTVADVEELEKRSRSSFHRKKIDANKPTSYDILSCIEKYEPDSDLDSFASNYGFEKPSEAVRAHKACIEQYNGIAKLFNEDELNELQEIN